MTKENIFDEWVLNKFLLGVAIMFYVIAVYYASIKVAGLITVSFLIFLWSVAVSKKVVD